MTCGAAFFLAHNQWPRVRYGTFARRKWASEGPTTFPMPNVAYLVGDNESTCRGVSAVLSHPVLVSSVAVAALQRVIISSFDLVLARVTM